MNWPGLGILFFFYTIFHCSINGGVRENLLAGGSDLWMELDGEGHLRLIDPESGSVHTCQPIHTIRVWGVGRDNGRDFAYVARDKETRRHRQVPITVPFGYSNLGYSGRAAYSDLNPRDGPPSVHK